MVGARYLAIAIRPRDATMPIYEYSCNACGHQFEALVRKSKTPPCPSCRSQDLERLLSLPTVQSSGTRAAALRAAKKRDATLGRERMGDQAQYERNHNE